MKITFSELTAKTVLKKTSASSADTLVLAVAESGKLTAALKDIDKQTKGSISKAIKGCEFKGKLGQAVTIVAPAGLDYARVVILGLGKAKELSEQQSQKAGGKLSAHLNKVRAKKVSIVIEAVGGSKQSATDIAANIAYGALLRSYRFDKYHTTKKPEEKPTLSNITIAVKGASTARNKFSVLNKIADGVFCTRDLVSEPANIIHPESLAAECKKLSKLGIKVEVLGEAQMKKLGMGALLGVGQGSAYESKLVIMRWNGAAKSKKPLAFVGKGVTFDTGGISIKPSKGMEDMKWDMGGSGVVIGLMKALAGRKAKVNAVGVVGLVENMPSSTAQRPGDVVTSMSGQTIEVINTDAEGRLVLADALWYTQKRFKPQWMIDLATLTGAIIVCLGDSRAGLFSNNDKLAGQIAKAADAVDEPVWRLPLGEEYDKQIDSRIADVQNVGQGMAGSTTAAQFLQRFVNKLPWAHLDIAGVAWANKDQDLWNTGATAFGVRMLDRLVADNYEK